MQDLILVNASRIVTDEQVHAVVGPLQMQFDRDFTPAWGNRATPVRVDFAPMADIPKIPHTSWCIFHNNHSLEEGALGWHDDQAGRIFSRVFVGDCLRLGLDWRVTVSHEALEMSADPDIVRAYRMANGKMVALEVADPVEADEIAYAIDGMKLSDFVLPAYFSHSAQGPFDHLNILKKPCPAMAPGGYLSIEDASGWHQIYADRADGIPGRRALFRGHRRMVRRPPSAMQVVA